MGATEVVSCELVVSGGDTSPVLEAAPEALDAITFLVGGRIVGDGPIAGCRRGDDGLDPAIGQEAAQVVCVVGLVGEQLSDRSGALDQLRSDGDVVDVSRGQDEDARPAFPVRERVELARPAAARGPERLLKGPPFPPAAERCALMWVLSM